jgi:ATP-dependent exoDNAse (exonuclease V) beta subunit
MTDNKPASNAAENPSAKSIQDTQQRLEATCPSQSFIVQAPAGSGKTELLSQRFLRLLAVVEQPEHIIALTFTKKAASEMKERILAALRSAHQDTGSQSAHKQYTATLAKAALAQDTKQQWNLLKHPHRLRIMTIDALCQRFSEAIPLFDKELPFAPIADSPSLVYQQAARACLRDAISEPSLQPAIQTLLEHLDNHQDQLITLFCELLACREQWLEIIYAAIAQSQSDFERALQHIEQHTLQRLLQALPFQHRETIRELTQRIALIESNPLSPRAILQHWDHFDDFNREYANGLAHLLLTQENTLRKSFDHHVGLKKGACPDYAALKERSQALCSLLKALPDFEVLLGQVKHLPQPFYTASQWQVLQALLTLLPVLVAELHLLFKKSNTLDFTQVSQQALRALGDDEDPTDLTLYLDHNIHHLLIDEFQDTSIQQLQLIEKIVHHWQPNEGKTLFVVGDPMQSIYRFRQAEVGLFLKVRNEGLGPVRLRAIELTSNFRSTDNIIHWINTQFKMIFPSQEDIESGAIAFHPSTAVLPSSPTSDVHALQFTSKSLEAEGVVRLIQEQLSQFPEDNVAILVRSRNQLTHIIQHLRKANIAFQGVDINPLAKLSHLRDMWTLTKALLYPACRLSALSLLRSPYCGLTLSDIEIIAQFDPKNPIYSALQQLEQLPRLSEEGRIRAQFVFQVLENALATRHQHTLVQWIMTTAKQLHADLLLKPHQHTELEQFWQLLEKHIPANQCPDLSVLTHEFEKLYSKHATVSRLHIMTIHKSKGLEFDCVIIPGVSAKSNPPDNPLIRWLKIPTQQHKEYLLVSPIKATHEKESALYNYLRDIDAEKADYELQRLFYVAVTRAKKRLYLLDNQARENKGSFRQLLKNHLFTDIETKDIPDDETLSLLSNQGPLLTRLPIDFYQKPPVFPTTAFNKVPPMASADLARQTGIIAHEFLQWICTYHPTSPEDLPWSFIEQRCKQQGFNQQQVKFTQDSLREQIIGMLNSPIGQWLCQAHTDEKNEYALLVQESAAVKTRVLDRTFIEQDKRWIIDFKTGLDDSNHETQHQKQVNYYAELLAPTSSHPIWGGLYYLATNRWVSWSYSPPKTQKALEITPV